MLRQPIGYWASAHCHESLLLGCGWRGYGREACFETLEML
jgi:hypothetical protein